MSQEDLLIQEFQKILLSMHDVALKMSSSTLKEHHQRRAEISKYFIQYKKQCEEDYITKKITSDTFHFKNGLVDQMIKILDKHY